jgi:ABC-type Mn2+/Zn2+ transport system ATPase subunit
MAETNNILIDLENICFSYPGREQVLHDLNFRLRSGERLGLIGPNGSGK